MPTDAEARWPHFELVTFPEPIGIPRDLAAPLLDLGAPKGLLGFYRAASELTLLDDPGSGQFVCFGTSGLFDKICLDPRTGAVVYIIYVPSDFSQTINLPSGPRGPARQINASLERFIASVRAVFARFPFDEGDGGENDDLENAKLDDREEAWDRAADELEETLRGIDPVAVADANSFWMTFLDDVRIGDFSTDMVVGAAGG